MADKELEKYEKKRQKEHDKFEAERKKWKQQETKKRVQKSSKYNTTLLFKIAAVAVSLAIVLGIVGIYASSYAIPARFYRALTVEKMKVYEPEWVFHFYTEYMNVANTAAQYAQYGLSSLVGLDLAVSPFGQESPYPAGDDENGPKLTWDAFLHQRTNLALQTGRAVYAEALKAGVTLSEEAQKEIDEGMEKLREDARQYGVSVSAMLRMNYTPGITERFYRGMFERDAVVAAFREQKQEEMRGKYTDDMLKKEYDEDPSAYDLVDLRIQPFSKEKLALGEGESVDAFDARQEAANAEKKKEAEAFLAAAGTEDAFIAAAKALADKAWEEQQAAAEDPEGDTPPAYDEAQTLALHLKKEDVGSRYQSEPMAGWAFDTARKAGDRDVIETESAFYAVYIARAPYAPVTVDFYTLHVPVATDEYAGPEEAEQAKEIARERAEEILAGWKKDGGTKEAFVERIRAYAREEEDPQAEDPDLGLNKAAKPGEMVDPIDHWIFAKGRKAGDCEIIDNEDGFTLVYLASQNEDDFVWKSEIADRHVTEDYEAYLQALLLQYKVEENPLGIDASLKAAQRLCDNFVLSYANYNG